MYYRNKIVDQAISWLGKNEADGSHKEIIDVYNSYTPLARSYKVQYNNSWCATFVSACSIKCGYTSIIPTECSCGQMIELFKKLDSWEEKDSFIPSAGDVIFYDWDDVGSGDNAGWPDHVGIVEKVEDNVITVIEGNYDDSVKRRTIKVNAKNIRGYGLPKYDAEEKKEEPVIPSKVVVASDYAKSYDKSLSGSYSVTASMLNVRHGAGTSKKVMIAIPKGTVVKNYGYYTKYGSVKWLYVQFVYNEVNYTGFCSAKYLKRV